MNKQTGWFALGAVLSLIFAIGASSVSAFSIFNYTQGGTGTSTPNIGQLVWWGSTHLDGVATTTATCAGTASCSTFTVIGSSPVTITGSGGGGGTYPFTPGVYNGNQISATSTGIRDTVALPAYGFIASSTFFTYSSTTALTDSGPLYLTNLTSGQILSTDVNGLVFKSASTTFTSPLTYTNGTNAVTCPTCNVSSATVTSVGSGTGLAGGPITTAGTLSLPTIVGTSSSETAANVPFYTTTSATPALLSGGDSTFTFVSASKKLIMLNATSTNLSATGSFFTSTTGTLNNTNGAGQLAVNTTAASSSLQFGEGTVFATSSNAFTWATTSPSTAATDTIMVINGARGIKFDTMGCGVVGGTATVALGNGVATSTYFQAKTLSTAVIPVTLSSNNSFSIFAPIFIAIGTYSANTITNVSCGFGTENTY